MFQTSAVSDRNVLVAGKEILQPLSPARMNVSSRKDLVHKIVIIIIIKIIIKIIIIIISLTFTESQRYNDISSSFDEDTYYDCRNSNIIPYTSK